VNLLPDAVSVPVTELLLLPEIEKEHEIALLLLIFFAAFCITDAGVSAHTEKPDDNRTTDKSSVKILL
jgi:hypothetical protein